MTTGDETTSTINYANPVDLPPNGTNVTIQEMYGDTVVVIPPQSSSKIVSGWIALSLLFAWPAIFARELLFSKRVASSDWAIVGAVLAATLVIFGFGAWQLRRNANYPTIIRANTEMLLLVRPWIIFRTKRWKTKGLQPISVTIGSPSMNGRMVANLRVGSWIRSKAILVARDKGELLWIARMLNRAMGKA